MSHDEPTARRALGILASGYFLYLVLAPVLIFGGIFLVVILTGSTATTPTTNAVRGRVQTAEDGLDSIRQSLTRQTHLVACRTALQQLNSELGDKPDRRPPALTNEQKDWLRRHLSPSVEELAEVETSHFTRLDNYHLFQCFLMRDIANALEIKGVRSPPIPARAERGMKDGTVREKPLDRAARAFAWVMREVRLRPSEKEEAPSSFVVRRGTGSVLERALVFLDLLEQLGDPEAKESELLGFLLQTPNGSGGLRLWACGVVVGDDKNVYLFDPNLGLPLPGPNGEGIATLAQVCKQPDILAQLNFDDMYRYPVTSEQVRAAQAQVVCPLSSLSPRMRQLQDKLLAPAVRVRLAADAANNLDRVRAACAEGVDKPIAVSVSRDRATLLHRFLPADEGGTDATNQERRFLIALVPWRTLPAELLDERKFPPQIDLGNRVRELFAAPFVRTTMEAGLARDRMLRGRYSSAVPELVDERARWRNQREQAVNADNLEAKFDDWLAVATRAYAKQIRAKTPQERELADREVNLLWQEKQALPLYVIINAAAATAREPEVAYQLGLCSQEQAEQLQARLDLQASIGATVDERDREKAATAWRKALSDWQRFEEDYPNHLDRFAARRLRGRAASELGDPRAAVAAWKIDNIPNPPNTLEILASLYLAQQEQKKHPQ
jgi:hypothetical protein